MHKKVKSWIALTSLPIHPANAKISAELLRRGTSWEIIPSSNADSAKDFALAATASLSSIVPTFIDILSCIKYSLKTAPKCVFSNPAHRVTQKTDVSGMPVQKVKMRSNNFLKTRTLLDTWVYCDGNKYALVHCKLIYDTSSGLYSLEDVCVFLLFLSMRVM